MKMEKGTFRLHSGGIKGSFCIVIHSGGVKTLFSHWRLTYIAGSNDKGEFAQEYVGVVHQGLGVHTTPSADWLCCCNAFYTVDHVVVHSKTVFELKYGNKIIVYGLFWVQKWILRPKITYSTYPLITMCTCVAGAMCLRAAGGGFE